MKTIKTTFLSILLISAFACNVIQKQSGNKTDIELTNRLESYTIAGQYENIYVYTINNETSPKMPVSFLNILVYDQSNKHIVWEETFREGEIEWLNEKNIKIYYSPGNREKNASYFIIYDLEKLSKIKSNNQL